MPYKFSPSSLGLLKDCPRCFWLKFNKGIRRPNGIFPSLPSGMDRILKTHFDSFMQRGKLPPELAGIDKNEKLFEDTLQLEIWRNNRKGIRWNDDEGNILMGAVDNLLQKGDKLVVMDHKTRGYPLKKGIANYSKDQMDIYNFLLRKNGFKTENYSYLLFYHPIKVNENGHIVFHTDLVKLSVDEKNAQNIFNYALKVLNEKCPKTNDCNWCKII